MIKVRLTCFSRNSGKIARGLLMLSVISFLVAPNLSEARDPNRVRDPKPIIHDVFVTYDAAPGTGMTLDISGTDLCLFPVDPFTGLPDLTQGCINPTVQLGGAAIGVVGTPTPGLITAHVDPAINDVSRLLSVIHNDEVEFEVTFGAVGPQGPAGVDGVNGTKGTKGTKGTNGAPGPQGASPWGLNGLNTHYLQGNVGIGTTAPIRPLHLRGPGALMRIDRNSPAPGILFARYPDGTTDWSDTNIVNGFGIIVTNQYFGIVEDNDGGLGGPSISRFVIKKTTGNVGIGTVNPQSKLAIVGLPTGTSALNAGVSGNAAGAVCITTSGNLYIDTDGNCN